MHGFKKTLKKISKTVHPRHSHSSKSNPFDSDNEQDHKQTQKSSTSPAPKLATTNFSRNPFDDETDITNHSSQNSRYSGARNRSRHGVSDKKMLEDRSVEELEKHALSKAEETTHSVNGCLKIAEEIRSGAIQTSSQLHEQGERLTMTHQRAADIDRELSQGEKLLGRLGGMFSRTWKPKLTRRVAGPIVTGDDVTTRTNYVEQRNKLGLNFATRKRESKTPSQFHEATDVYNKIEVEKSKQDESLSDISNILEELKNMAVDMGTEIERQNKGMDHLHDDMVMLNDHVDQANRRGRSLLK